MPVKRENLERHRHYFKAVLSIDIDVGLVNLWFMHLKIQSRGENWGNATLWKSGRYPLA